MLERVCQSFLDEPICRQVNAGRELHRVSFDRQTALAAGIAVLVVRILEDYLVIPRVLGDAVGLTPLVVLVAVTSCGLLFGGFAVILAIPLAAVASDG